MNCLVFDHITKMANFWQNVKSIIRGFCQFWLGIFSECKILVPLECAVNSEWNDTINAVMLCLVVELFILYKTQKSSLQWPNTCKYLNNRECYDKTVCTISFSSRWWVYWYELFSFFKDTAKMAKTGQNTKSIIREFHQFWDIFVNMRYWYQ